jgi:alpha-L-fucosidase
MKREPVRLPFDCDDHSRNVNGCFFSRRDFLKLALAASSPPLLPSFGFGSVFNDERTAWYRAAKFGMFIHWGPYSLASVEASWLIMVPKPGGITEAEYRELPKRFNPTKFDPYSFV